MKIFKSSYYNYSFDPKTGVFMRWGRHIREDAVIAPAPEIADIEISTVCNGLGTPCKFCYKSNTKVGRNMNFDTFKKVFDKFPKSLTQIAFGIGDLKANEDIFRIFEYCRVNEVVPNATINGFNLTRVDAEILAKLCGAVAVSRYNPKDVCYDAVKMLTDFGMKQVNIHQLVAAETMQNCMDTISDIKTDARLGSLNAIVFLSLKPKGTRNTLVTAEQEDYKRLIDTCLERDIHFGFDSCAAHNFLKAVRGTKREKEFRVLTEPCESSLFSCYINVEGKYFPCSFSEGTGNWKEGLDVVDCKDFIEDIWNHPKTLRFRSDLLARCRECPLFNI